MTESQTFPSLTRQVLEEHQQIHFYLDQIERSRRALQQELPPIELLRRIGAQAEGLRERLQEHFASEEEGGLFRAVSELVPGSRDQIEGLVSQHGRVLEMLEMVRIRAQYGDFTEAEVLGKELAELLALLRDHEAQEEALLSAGMERDRRA